MKAHTDLERFMARTDKRLLAILQELKMAEATLDDLQTSVAAETTVEQSAMTLLKGLSDKLTAAGTDPAKITALKNEIDANAQALADAVAANTPGATPAPAPAPAPSPSPAPGA
jgi:hypothetical protein